MKNERLARLIIFTITFGFVVSALAFRIYDKQEIIEVHAAMPDQGGWLTSDIDAQVGEPLKLRLISDDVVHSFAIGQMDVEPVEVLPGKATEITLTFDHPGTYTYYCTRWCGADHWRMRGTITVVGDEQDEIVDMAAEPLYMQLGIDLDAEHELNDLTLAGQPSAQNGLALGLTLPPEILAQEYYRSQSPYQVWQELKGSKISEQIDDAQIWELVAWIWEQNTSSVVLAVGKDLYQRDCAACHGVEGAGDGIFGGKPASGNSDHAKMTLDGALEEPTDFSDPAHMLGASPAIFQGKILRGGMGTGMPSWGLIYTDEQTWALVDYLWSFVFDYSLED